MRLKAVGHRVLVKPVVIEEKTQSGLYKPQQTIDAEKGAVDRGTVVEVGPDAYSEFPSQWCKPGDMVVWPRYAGKPVKTDDEEMYHVLNDEDVLLIWED